MDIHSRQWKKLRQLVLIRDSYACQLLLPGCTGRAETVDHRKARVEGGSSDWENLRAACWSCNLRKEAERKVAAGGLFFSPIRQSVHAVVPLPPQQPVIPPLIRHYPRRRTMDP
jgi:hypothetical protein